MALRVVERGLRSRLQHGTGKSVDPTRAVLDVLRGHLRHRVRIAARHAALDRLNCAELGGMRADGACELQQRCLPFGRWRLPPRVAGLAGRDHGFVHLSGSCQRHRNGREARRSVDVLEAAAARFARSTRADQHARRREDVDRSLCGRHERAPLWARAARGPAYPIDAAPKCLIGVARGCRAGRSGDSHRRR